MAVARFGTVNWVQTLQPAGTPGSQITYAHNQGKRAQVIWAADTTTGKDYLENYEILVGQPTDDTLTVANLLLVPITVRIYAQWIVHSIISVPIDSSLAAISQQTGPGPGPTIGGLFDFGDGSDGDVVIAINTTLTRSMFYNNLTVNPGATLNPGGFKIFARGIVTNNGTIARNGNNGGNAVLNVGGAVGAAVAANDVGGGGAASAGTTGGTGIGFQSAILSTFVGSGGNGGNGGAGGNGVSAGGATSTGIAVNLRPARWATTELIAGLGSSAQISIGGGGAGRGGSSGGGGGVGNTAGGGGGGASGGGVVAIFANQITNNGLLSANGANGGVGETGTGGVAAKGGGGGGGGSGGGLIYLVFNQLIDVGSSTVTAGSGGAGGAGLNGGTAGAAGTDGVVGLVRRFNALTRVWS